MKRFLSTWSVLLIVAVSSFVVTSCSSDDDDDAVKVENKVGGKVPKVSEAVDLGLSVKWAPWNVGASQPTDYGEYFTWGEVTPGIDSEGYRYYEGFDNEAKYNLDEDWKLSKRPTMPQLQIGEVVGVCPPMMSSGSCKMRKEYHGNGLRITMALAIMVTSSVV